MQQCRHSKLTIFSSSEILMSCWWICWFFISKTSLRLFRSSSMCLYGAKASWKRQTALVKTSSTWFLPRWGRVLERIRQNSPLSVHLCSGAELLQTASLGLGGCDSGTSACPPDPSERGIRGSVTAWIQENCYFKSHTLPAETVWSSQTLLPETWSVVHEPFSDLTHGTAGYHFPSHAAPVKSSKRGPHLKYSLLTVLACSSCRVARVSLWVVSISIKEASWLSFSSSICTQDWNSWL